MESQKLAEQHMQQNDAVVVIDEVGLMNKDLIRRLISMGLTNFKVTTNAEVFKQAIPPLVMDDLLKASSSKEINFEIVGRQTPEQYLKAHPQSKPIVVLSKDSSIPNVALHIPVPRSNLTYPTTQILHLLSHQFKDAKNDRDKIFIGTLFRDIWANKSILKMGMEAPQDIQKRYAAKYVKETQATENWKRQNANLKTPMSAPLVRAPTITITRGDRSQTKPIEVLKEDEKNNQTQNTMYQEIGTDIVQQMQKNADEILNELSQVKKLVKLKQEVSRPEFMYNDFNILTKQEKEAMLSAINEVFLELKQTAKSSSRASYGALFSSAIYTTEQKMQIETLKNNFISILKSEGMENVSKDIAKIIDDPGSVVNAIRKFAFGNTTTREIAKKILNPARK